MANAAPSGATSVGASKKQGDALGYEIQPLRVTRGAAALHSPQGLTRGAAALARGWSEEGRQP